MVIPSVDRTREAGIDRAREDRIGRELSSEFSSAQILQRAVRQAVKGVDGCDHAGISLRSHLGEVQTPAWTSPAVWAADAIQIALDEGPSLEPMWISDQVIVDDLSTNQRWPQWAPEVVKLGLRSLISVRLPGGTQTFSALNLYSDRAYGFGPQSLDQACSYAVGVLEAIQTAGGATGFEGNNVHPKHGGHGRRHDAVPLRILTEACAGVAADVLREVPRQSEGRRQGVRLRREERMTAKSTVLAQLVRVVASEDPDQPLPLRLSRAAAAILGADGAAITLCYTEATRLTVCLTDQVAAKLEDLQDVLREGPGPDAYSTGRMVRAALGERSSRRWPAFAAAAKAELGPVAISAIPIQPGIDVLGVLTLYQLPARPLVKEPTLAQFVADTLGAALLRDGGLQEDLGNGPWSTHAKVHQAAGMVIAQLGVGPDDALALLRAHAYADGASMATIAQAVVERRLDFSLEDDSRATEI